jgi:diguanylate cyclase (GGDEF)-like protein
MTVRGSDAAIPAGDDVWDDHAEHGFLEALPIVLEEVFASQAAGGLADAVCRGVEELIEGVSASLDAFPPTFTRDTVFGDALNGDGALDDADRGVWSIVWYPGRVEVRLPLHSGGYPVGELVVTAPPGRWIRRQERRQLRRYADLAGPPLHLALRAEALQRFALTDELTGLANRRALDHELDSISLGDRRLRLLLLDLDRLKQVNDTLGYDQGDTLITTLADTLREAAREGELVARLGGDEFVMVLPDASSKRAKRRAEWIRTEFARRPLSPGVAAVGCGVSIGIIKARPGEDPRQLVRRAARSMRGQKRRRSSDPR